MDKKMLEYRKKHPKCKFCKYLSLEGGEIASDYHYYWECELKEKIITYPHMLRFCKYYTMKGEDENEVSINKTNES